MSISKIKRPKMNPSDIPVVILCGGKGTRLGQLTADLPKPLIKVGDKPILWHVMKIYASQGCRTFILCLGYKGEEIIKYFKDNNPENWTLHFVDTGVDTLKSQRIKKVQHLIHTGIFFLAYGDDLSNVNLNKLLNAHQKLNLVVTLTTVRVVSEFGIIEIDKNNRATQFKEKPVLDKWMNGGFMVVNQKIFQYLDIGELEDEVFKHLAKSKQINVYKHTGQWKAMNTLKDNLEFNELWNKNKAFWKIWE